VSGFDLGEYLQQARSEGRQDSEGSFTVAQDKALKKLAHFALPGEFDWVLKVVQAANAWSCPVLLIRQSRVATSFFFQPAVADFPSDSSLVQALREGSLTTGNPLHELCMALRSLVDQAKLSFVLATRECGRLGEPIFSGDDVSALNVQVRRRWSHLGQDGLRLTVSHFKANESFTGRYVPTLTGVPRRDVGIARILEARALFSPTPIILDGRDITSPFCNGLAVNEANIVFAGGPYQENGVDWHCYPALLNREQIRRPKWLKRETSGWCLLCSLTPVAVRAYRQALEKPMGTVELRYVQSIPHLVHWIRHGVVCRHQAIFNSSVSTRFHIAVRADIARTDLSGLAITSDAAPIPVQQAAQNSLWVLLEQVAQLAHQNGDIQPPSDSEEETLDLTLIDAAGYSVFTEGLKVRSGGIFNWLRRRLNHLKRPVDKQALMKDWSRFLQQEVKAIERDLRRTPKEKLLN